jgi:hypothetical protein
LIHEPLCAVRTAQTCLAAVKSRQAKNSLNSLPIHHLPTSPSALAGQQCGGLIARARPDIDPHPAAIRVAILHHLETLPPAPHQRAENYNIAGTEPVIAYDGEVSQIAATLTRFALDLALGTNPSAFPYSAYLIGLRKEWIFSQPFDTYPIAITGEGWDTAPDLPSRDQDRTEAIKVLLHIADEGQHVNADSST